MRVPGFPSAPGPLDPTASGEEIETHRRVAEMVQMVPIILSMQSPYMLTAHIAMEQGPKVKIKISLTNTVN